MLDTPIRISPRITVGPQPLEEKDLEKLASKGFKTVVNLSKKGELEQQFDPVQEGQIVESLGMDYLHLPLSLSNVKSRDIEDFCLKLGEADTPAYVHCRIGQRSSPLSLIYHAIAKRLTAEQVLKKAQKLGFKWEAPMIPAMVSRYLKNA